VLNFLTLRANLPFRVMSIALTAEVLNPPLAGIAARVSVGASDL
jgi:hypothetical protein